jgi:hypothetical protein
MCSSKSTFRTVGLTACICLSLCSAWASSALAAPVGADETPVLSVPTGTVPSVYDRPLRLDTEDPQIVAGGDPRGPGCGNVVYDDTGGAGFVSPIYNATDDTFPWIYCGDDVTLAGTDRFVCELTVRLGTTNINTVASFPYTFEFWDVAGTTVCPDSGATMLYQSSIQIATGFTASFQSVAFTTAISPPQPVANTFWIILRTSNHATDANGGIPYVRVRSGGVVPEVGQTADFFYVGYNNNSCNDPGHFLVYNGTPAPITGFAYKLLANIGPSGSCCNQATGICTEGINLGNCGAFNQSWNINPGCPQGCAICDVVCTGSNLTENEPTCAANYIDTTNNGCSFDEGTESFINVSCGADICGTFGTYTFLNGTVTVNRRDNDYYRLTLTSPRQVTFSATGEATMNVVIFIPRLGPGQGPCDDIGTIDPGGTSTGSSSAGCAAATATTCLPAGTYYLVARANTTIGIPCGLQYRATVTCAPCTLPVGACCLPAGCSPNVEEIRCLQQGGIYRGDGTSCVGANCPPPPVNETCTTKSNVPAITTNTTIAIETTFAVTESTANITECNNLPIYKDIWFDYRIVAANQPAGVTNGRIAVSTWESCFDSRLIIYRVLNCNSTQAIQCTSELVPLVCNDDINTDRGNLASYLQAETNGDEENPTAPAPGECYKIRVGGATVDAGGAGFLRVDYLPSLPAPWSSSSGRCCFPNGSCQIYPADGTCQTAGGYLTSTVDFGEGDTTVPGANSAGCHVLPCPAAGEACFNALNLHSNPATGILGSGFGTTTRAITNKLYYRYQIPTSVQPGSGITITTCGSDFDTAIAVYSDFDQDNGECTGTTLAHNDNCTPSDTSAAGANGIASCFTAGETDSCLCITVGSIGQATGPGSVIYIEIGAHNGIAGSTLPSVDPVPANCGTAVTASITVTASAACFVCSVPCPGGSVQENEPLCGPNYVDTTNGGCNSSPAAFKDITCGQTVCGQAGTYVFTNGTTQQSFRDTDWYRFTVTSAKTVVINLKAGFQSQMFLVAAANISNQCDTITLATETATAGCLDTSITQPVCAGTFYIVVAPSVFTGVDCGSPYTMTLNCNAAVAANCCKGDLDNNGTLNGRDISLFIKNLLLPPIASLPTTGCYNLNTCRADMNGDFVLTTADIPLFVTALLTKAACPSLPTCTDPARCHLTDQSGGAVSDIGTSVGCSRRVVDDFKADSSGNIVNICWYGSYLNFLNGTACTPQTGSSPDSFCVTIYNDNAGVPGTVRGGPFCALSVTKTDTGIDIPFTGFGNAREFRYAAAIPAVAVTSGTCYWIEIVNSTSGNCCWLWSLSGFVNDVSASHSGGPAGTPNYVAGDLDTGDFAFCLNDIRINKRDCGLPQGRCCYNAGNSCQVTDVFNCQNVLHGAWLLNGNCSAPCPIPGANDCINALPIPLNTSVDGTTLGQTTDGPQPSCDTTNTAPDVWYTFQLGIGGNTTITLCPAGGTTDYDSIMALYTGNCGSLNEVGCNDDACTGAGASRIQFSNVANTLYHIRILGWNGNAGNYTVRITQP